MSPHVHANAKDVVLVIAIIMGANFLLRTVAAHHANNPVLRGLMFNLG